MRFVGKKLEFKTLSEICDIVSGGTPSRSRMEFWNNGDIPWIKIGNLNGKYVEKADEYITKLGLENSAAKVLPKGTILYTIFATLGETAILSIDACTNQAIAGICIKDNLQVSTDYIYYFLKSKKKFVSNIGRGVAQNNINMSILKAFKVPLPEHSVQSEIVDILDKTVNIINMRQAELEKLDRLVKARFVEMFGDPSVNNKRWQRGVINEIGSCIAGATPSTKVDEYWNNGTIPWMSSGEVNKGRIDRTDNFITHLGYDKTSTKLVPPKTVVLAMAGQGRTRGMAAITEIELCTNQSICSIVNNEKIDAEYLLYFLKLQYNELRRASTNTDGRGGLNLKIIGNYPIMIPPVGLQKRFANFVEQVDKSKVEVQRALDEAQLLFDSLMQKYFG